MDSLATLHIQHLNILPSTLTGPFFDECERLSIPFEVHETEPQPFNAVEDYIPTAIAIYLAKPFIDAFLKKAGEDGYILFKNALARLASRAREVRLRVMTSGDKKSDPNYPFSRVFSIYSKSACGTPVKFLFPHSLTDAEYDEAIETLALFLEDTPALESGRRMGHLILMEFNLETKSWVERSSIIPNG